MWYATVANNVNTRYYKGTELYDLIRAVLAVRIETRDSINISNFPHVSSDRYINIDGLEIKNPPTHLAPLE